MPQFDALNCKLLGLSIDGNYIRNRSFGQIVYDNPLAFFNQSVHFQFRRSD